jgi:hypothetical protein
MGQHLRDKYSLQPDEKKRRIEIILESFLKDFTPAKSNPIKSEKKRKKC